MIITNAENVHGNLGMLIDLEEASRVWNTKVWEGICRMRRFDPWIS